MIPDFSEGEVWPVNEEAPYRVLPDGVYSCEHGEIEQHFVHAFPSSETRGTIQNGFLKMSQEADGFGLCATSWIGGSFTTSKLNPGDLDLCWFLDLGHLETLEFKAANFVKTVLDGREASKKAYQCHSFFIVAVPLDHPAYSIYEDMRVYWRTLWGRTRQLRNPDEPDNLEKTLPEVRRGLLKLHLGNPSLIPDVSESIEGNHAS